MAAKHTPIPWTVVRGQGYCSYRIVQGEKRHRARSLDPKFNPDMSYGVASSQEHEGNRRLIAAAPFLLEAVKTILSRLNDPENPSAQMVLYSDSLHPFSDDDMLTLVDYLKEVVVRAEKKEGA